MAGTEADPGARYDSDTSPTLGSKTITCRLKWIAGPLVTRAFAPLVFGRVYGVKSSAKKMRVFSGNSIQKKFLFFAMQCGVCLVSQTLLSRISCSFGVASLKVKGQNGDNLLFV